MRLTGAQALVRILAAEQVPFAFGIVGGKLAPLLHAIAGQTRIRFVGTRHEAPAAMMAAAVYAGTGRIAVALGEMGPGGLNLASGTGVAFNNNLAACWSPPTSTAPPPIRMAACSWTWTRAPCCGPSPSGTPWCTTRAAFRNWRDAPFAKRSAAGRARCTSTSRRTCWSQACDFADDEFDLAPARYRAVGGPRPNAARCDRCLRSAAQARRPLIVAGGGVVASGAEAQ